jgi:hypothetical protein
MPGPLVVSDILFWGATVNVLIWSGLLSSFHNIIYVVFSHIFVLFYEFVKLLTAPD